MVWVAGRHATRQVCRRPPGRFLRERRSADVLCRVPERIFGDRPGVTQASRLPVVPDGCPG